MKKIDKIIISIIAGIAFISLVTILILQLKPKSNNLYIEYHGNVITEIDGELLDLNVDRIFTIGDSGEENVFQIKNGEISCISANCPDQICVNTGAISEVLDNEMIVCLPHELLVEVQ